MFRVPSSGRSGFHWRRKRNPTRTRVPDCPGFSRFGLFISIISIFLAVTHGNPHRVRRCANGGFLKKRAPPMGSAPHGRLAVRRSHRKTCARAQLAQCATAPQRSTPAPKFPPAARPAQPTRDQSPAPKCAKARGDSAAPGPMRQGFWGLNSRCVFLFSGPRRGRFPL